MQTIWIEIPVADRQRAKRFYAAVTGEEGTDIANTDGHAITVFAGEPTVSLNQADGFVPSREGALPYFHVVDLDGALSAAAASGGQVVDPPKARGAHGRFALVHDSEGNALYLHGAG